MKNKAIRNKALTSSLTLNDRRATLRRLDEEELFNASLWWDAQGQAENAEAAESMEVAA